MDRAEVFKTYPNIYVMLHADSGLKKGPPVAMAKNLVTPVNNTTIISGRSSIQGILKKLGGGESLPGGKVKATSTAFICSSELSSSIVEDRVATKILTDLYDRQYNVGEWESLLKMENFHLKNPTITMLTATNEAMSEDFFTKSAIQGGYFARTFIVYEKESKVVNSLVFPLHSPPNYSNSSNYLKELAKLNGPFKPIAALESCNEYKYRKVKFGRDIWFSEPGIIYDDWYEDFKETMKISEHKDETGTMNRFGDSVLKVAMLLSLANAPELVLTAESMHEAISECQRLLGNVRKTTLGRQGISQSALLKTLIIMELLNRQDHQVSRPILMKKMWANYENATEFDDMMLSFDQSGMIKTTNIGNTIVYVMPPEQVKELKDFMEAKESKNERL